MVAPKGFKRGKRNVTLNKKAWWNKPTKTGTRGRNLPRALVNHILMYMGKAVQAGPAYTRPYKNMQARAKQRVYQQRLRGNRKWG